MADEPQNNSGQFVTDIRAEIDAVSVGKDGKLTITFIVPEENLEEMKERVNSEDPTIIGHVSIQQNNMVLREGYTITDENTGEVTEIPETRGYRMFLLTATKEA